METAEQVQAPAQRGDVQAASVATQADRPKSGYARLRLRHKALIQDYSTLRHDTEALLQAHAKLMSSRADHAPPWHQSASRILDLLELEPDCDRCKFSQPLWRNWRPGLPRLLRHRG